MFADPQVRHRGLQLELRRSDGGVTPSVASPLKLTGTPPAYEAPPLLGEHTEWVLSQLLGTSTEEISALRPRGPS